LASAHPGNARNEASPCRSDPDNDRSEVTIYAICSRCRAHRARRAGSENADKCAWIETQNITLGGHQYAIQPTWSNEAFDAGKDGCAISR
jgi:hypothetical protein